MNVIQATKQYGVAAMTLTDICKQLVDDGWREFLDPLSKSDVSLFKRFETSTRCVHNGDKPGIQATIHLWDWSKYPQHKGLSVSLEVEVCGSTAECSYTIKAHAHNNVADTLAEIPRLLAAWEAVNASR